MRIPTREEYRIVENAVDEFCLQCPENTLEDESICEKCRIRAFIDFISLRAKVIINEKPFYIENNSIIRFTFHDGKPDEIIELRIGIIDATHISLTRLYDGKPSEYSQDIHTLQLEGMIRTSSGSVDLLQSGKPIKLKDKG